VWLKGNYKDPSMDVKEAFSDMKASIMSKYCRQIKNKCSLQLYIISKKW
jgi:hypothetical protein